MDKTRLHEAILFTLRALSKNAADAANQAHATATNKESVAENKYDTFGLEASYLAQGQAKRVAECEKDVEVYLEFKVTNFSEHDSIDIGALIHLKSDKGMEQQLFLGPAAGGAKLVFDNKDITLITNSSPLGKILIGQYIGDSVGLQGTAYEILNIQ